MNRSRQKAFLTGMNGTIATDKVRGVSELAETDGFNNVAPNNNSNGTNGMGGNYQTGFMGGMNGTMFLGQPDYSNPNNTLHNNIGNRVLLEQTFDNKIFIDASFRDYSRHCEPFKFTVKFNGTNAKTESVYIIVDGVSYSYPKYIEGDTDVVIDRVFKNVRYVNVNALILPNHITFKTDPDGSYSHNGTSLAKTHYKYIILKINELRNGRYYSNNPALGRESFIMKMDTDICINNQIWIPIHKNVSYFDSQLKLVDRLTVEICDDKGIRLCGKLDGKCHDFFADYRKTIDKVLHLQKLNTPEAMEQIEELTPKLSSLKGITESLSPELHLTFNTIEPQIDTKPQYRY